MTGILRTYRVNNTNRSVNFFMPRDIDNEIRFDMDQPYQRGIVWGLKRKQNLIKSMLMGIPIPAIVINDRFAAKFSHADYERERNWTYAVVDGKQRVSTIQGFATNQFPVPAGWWDETMEGLMIWWTELSLPQQRHFRNIVLPVAEGQFSTLDQERELFDLVNFGGLAQGEVDND